MPRGQKMMMKFFFFFRCPRKEKKKQNSKKEKEIDAMRCNISDLLWRLIAVMVAPVFFLC
jgi:hypothetical protein